MGEEEEEVSESAQIANEQEDRFMDVEVDYGEGTETWGWLCARRLTTGCCFPKPSLVRRECGGKDWRSKCENRDPNGTIWTQNRLDRALTSK